MKIIFALNILFMSFYSSANCSDLLRFQILKNLGSKNYLFSREFSQRKDKKIKKFEAGMQRFEDLKEVIFHKTLQVDLNFVKAFDSGIIPVEFMDALFMLRVDVNSLKTYKDWLLELYNDVALQIYLSKDPVAIKQFEKEGAVSKNIIISVILERSKEGGFSGKEQDIEVIGDIIEDHEFSEILTNGKYIYDYYQQDSPHGDLIHMFNLDFMIFSLRKNNDPVQLASRIYKWMGYFIDIEYGENEEFQFNVLNDVWAHFFDSTDMSLTSPELLNGRFLKFFGIDSFELPDFAIKRGYYL